MSFAGLEDTRNFSPSLYTIVWLSDYNGRKKYASQTALVVAGTAAAAVVMVVVVVAAGEASVAAAATAEMVANNQSYIERYLYETEYDERR